MADFNAAFEATIKYEGGYAFDPDDPGGETYRGIARLRHPSWSGWPIIDDIKKQNPPNLNTALSRNQRLQALVKAFYKEQFWNRMQGDQIADQAVANEVFDTGVNMGLRRSVRFLQESLNLLNRNQQREDITVDGQLGSNTLAALRKILRADRSSKYVVTLLNLFQGNRYVELMRNRPSLEKFARGWLKRTLDQ